MKLSDTIGLVLKSKDENRVLSVAPDQSVYEAIEKMAEHGIGALLVIDIGCTGHRELIFIPQEFNPFRDSATCSADLALTIAPKSRLPQNMRTSSSR